MFFFLVQRACTADAGTLDCVHWEVGSCWIHMWRCKFNGLLTVAKANEAWEAMSTSWFSWSSYLYYHLLSSTSTHSTGECCQNSQHSTWYCRILLRWCLKLRQVEFRYFATPVSCMHGKIMHCKVLHSASILVVCFFPVIGRPFSKPALFLRFERHSTRWKPQIFGHAINLIRDLPMYATVKHPAAQWIIQHSSFLEMPWIKMGARSITADSPLILDHFLVLWITSALSSIPKPSGLRINSRRSTICFVMVRCKGRDDPKGRVFLNI